MRDSHRAEAELARFRQRLLTLVLAVLLAFGGLGWRLYTLQVQRHVDFVRQAETNRTAVVPIVPNRGEIFDRNGVVLASNYRSYTLEINPARLEQPLAEVIDAIDEMVPISRRDRRRFARMRAGSKGFESLPIRAHLSDDEVARFAAQRWRFPGVEIKARLFRIYPQGDVGAHIIGYIGRINQKEKERIEESEDVANYRGTDHIGKLGIEASYEGLLHGTTGIEQMETSAGGHAVRRLATRPAQQGASIQLSVDIRLQKLIEDMYGERRGALVAIDPRNGEVLALVSKPTFDPNLFVDGIDQESWDELNTSDDRPLLNRALRGLYPPGSTYKPFMGLAGLETGLRKADTVIMDRGSWTLAGHTFRSGHALGRVDLHSSIVKSSNVYYYQLANDMGVNGIHDFMKPLGFGQRTGIDVPGETAGILPSTQWKQEVFRSPEQQRWYAGETISLGIGQGYNSFTMLQLANATATLAAGGVRHVPRVTRAVRETGSNSLVDLPPSPGEDLGYQSEHVSAVLGAMVGVTLDGTSRAIFADAPYLSGGKTGTAQAVTVGQKAQYDAKKLAERQRDHSLYIAFAPAENPQIAVAAIIENAGFGSAHAAPLVRRVMDYWLAGWIPSDEDMAAIQAGKARAPIGEPRRVPPPAWSSDPSLLP